MSSHESKYWKSRVSQEISESCRKLGISSNFRHNREIIVHAPLPLPRRTKAKHGDRVLFAPCNPWFVTLVTRHSHLFFSIAGGENNAKIRYSERSPKVFPLRLPVELRVEVSGMRIKNMLVRNLGVRPFHIYGYYSGHSGVRKRPTRETCGQSLIESAIVMPFLLLLAFNAINFGYFYYVAINLSSAPRDGVTYSVQGFSTPEETDLPPAGSVSTLVYDNLTSSLPNSSSTPVQVCTAASGRDSSNLAICTTYGSPTLTYTPDLDPEAPLFTLNRIDVTYTVKPLISGQVFGITLLKSFTFHRQVSMRALD